MINQKGKKNKMMMIEMREYVKYIAHQIQWIIRTGAKHWPRKTTVYSPVIHSLNALSSSGCFIKITRILTNASRVCFILLNDFKLIIWSYFLFFWKPVPLYLHSVQALKNQRWTALSKKVAKGSFYVCEIYSHEFIALSSFQQLLSFQLTMQDVCFNH